MRFESLQYFLEVARSGSFSLAARRLYISHQGLGKSIHLLEQELGVTLFERSGKRVRLTEAGADLVPLARQSLEIQNKLIEAMQRHTDTPSGSKLRLSAVPFVAISLFNHMKSRLDAHDLRDVVLSEKGLTEIVQEIADPHHGDDVFGMVAIPESMIEPLLSQNNIAFAPLFFSRLGVFGTKDILSPRRRSISIKETAELPIACYKEPVLESLLKTTFLEWPLLDIVANTSNLSLIDEYVESGKAITFWDSLSAYLDEDPSGRIFVPIKNASAFYIGFVYPADIDRDGKAFSYITRFKTCVDQTCGAYLEKHPCQWEEQGKTRRSEDRF